MDYLSLHWNLFTNQRKKNKKKKVQLDPKSENIYLQLARNYT